MVVTKGAKVVSVSRVPSAISRQHRATGLVPHEATPPPRGGEKVRVFHSFFKWPRELK